jgi:hypothetical protein
MTSDLLSIFFGAEHKNMSFPLFFKLVNFMPLHVRYTFTKRFSVSAKKAFQWCTSFDPSDHLLMGNPNAQRQIFPLVDGALILKDIYSSSEGTVEKQKLVVLYPDQLTWTSTHLTGPNKHSQFLYQITPQGKTNSVLTFTAMHLENDEKADAKALAERLCREDAGVWAFLAGAMEKGLGQKRANAL